MTAQDLSKAAAELTPPVVFGAVRLAGMSLPDWVAAATLVYIVLQAAHLVWRWRRQAKRNSEAMND
jgi:hypothetical protein